MLGSPRLLPSLLTALAFLAFASLSPAPGAQQAARARTRTTSQPDYRAIDSHASSAPKEAEKTIADLSAYLCRSTKNDREKARAIFTWIASNLGYDWDTYHGSKKYEQRPEFTITQKCTDCLGHARLFEALSQAAGLEVAVVGGTVKQLEYGPDRTHTTLADNGSAYASHSWNAVKIDGEWQLLDVTFANGRAWEHGVLQVRRPTDDAYFLIRANELIYTHLPKEDKWQLVDPPYSHAQHERLPLLRPGFFKHQLQLVEDVGCIVEAGGVLTLTIDAPPTAWISADLRHEGQKVSGSCTFTQRGPKGFEIYAAFPAAGTYILRVWARRSGFVSGSSDLAMECRVNAKGGEDGSAGLPTAYPSFADCGAYLTSPSSGTLAAGQPHLFRISVPGALGVDVMTDSHYFPLQNQQRFFAGLVVLAPGEVLITARFARQPNSNHGLIKYSAR